MIARLWWKEARQVWPIWVFLAGLGLVWMGLVQWLVDAKPDPRASLISLALIIPFLYMFLIGAAVFAGERENRTLELLDALPVERWRIWTAKASFAAASTLALGLLLSLVAVALVTASLGSLPEEANVGRVALLVGFLALSGLGWSLFWSALSGNALLAAALGILSLTATLVQLDPKGTLTRGDLPLTVWNWGFALALIAASALILQFGGPPRASWLGARRRPLSDLNEMAEKNISRRRSNVVWPASAWRLIWQALREAWSVWWPLMAMGGALLALLIRTEALIDPGLWIFGAILVSLVLGANVFNAENRGGGQRFLASHGARPGVVWLVKLAVGLVVAAPIWLVWLMPSYWSVSKQTGAPEGWTSLQYNAVMIGSFIAGAFAAGAWCGMVFRRGITAALVSLIFWIAISLPPFAMLSVKLLWPTQLFWVPVAVVAVTWAWSGDWLLDRPGFGRWARLGLYSAAAVLVLLSAHVAERVLSVPTIPAAERARIFQFDRIAAAVPPEENAANLYREVAGKMDFPDRNQDADDQELIDWLSGNESSLETLRRAAAMPVCRFRDLRKATTFSADMEEPGLDNLANALAASSRVRFAQGDLKGAWEDIETLLRMGRQFSGLNPDSVRRDGYRAERTGLNLAIRWANDPRLTVELLKTARDAYRASPPPLSRVDQARADALITRNMVGLSRGDFLRGFVVSRSGRLSPPDALFEALALDAMTTPWEMARLRRVQDLLLAARIQSLERRPRQVSAVFPFINVYYGPRRLDYVPAADDSSNILVIRDGPPPTVLSSSDLRRLKTTTPLAAIDPPGREMLPNTRYWDDDNAYMRPALDVILSLRLWQARHGGRLPESLDELAKDDPEVRDSWTDPHSLDEPPARFGYVSSRGKSLFIFDPFEADSSAPAHRPRPTDGYMLLYSVGPDGRDDQAASNIGLENKGDIIFPIKDDVPPPE